MAPTKKRGEQPDRKRRSTPSSRKPAPVLGGEPAALEALAAKPLLNLSKLYDWSSGASAQVEIVGSDVPFKINCTMHWRPAIRSPILDMKLEKDQYKWLKDELGKLKEILGEGDRLARSGELAKLKENRGKTKDDLKRLGGKLFEYILPPDMKKSLRDSSDLFLEIGADEVLNEFPFELMHDGYQYCCLKHNVGRYVVTKRDKYPERPTFQQSTKRRVLLVAVPNPNIEHLKFPKLKGVKAEARAIESILRPILKDGLQTLPKDLSKTKIDDVKWDHLFDELREAHGNDRYDIIHFCGHAYFDKENPENSGLALSDRLLKPSEVELLIPMAQPLFCFVNACETVISADTTTDRFNLYGLGKSFLETGAYLLGSRSPIGDKAATAFANMFYSCLLEESRPLGESVRLAREACRSAAKDSFDWASYIFYGDPRVKFPSLPRSQRV